MKRLFIILLVCISTLLVLNSCNLSHECKAGEWTVQREATCVEEGLKVKKCIECGKIMESEALPLIDHDLGQLTYVEQEGVTNCLEKLYTKNCKHCNYSEPYYNVLSHNFSKTVVHSTCTELGYDKFTCKNCGWVELSYHKNLIAHNYRDEYVSDEYDHWHKCKMCDGPSKKESHTEGDDGNCTLCGAKVLPSPEVQYKLSDDGSYAIVTGMIGNRTKVKIARTYQGVPVTHIGNNAFENNIVLTFVYLPDTVTYIGNRAFYSSSYLGGISGFENITYIGDEAFYMCPELDLTEMPAKLEYIGARAFHSCGDVTFTHIPDSVSYIGDGAFYDCSRLQDVTIGDGVTHIGKETFAFCNLLGTVTLGKNVASIGEMAFYSSGIKEIILSDVITTIGKNAFGTCQYITKIHVGKSLVDFGDGSIANSGKLKEITLSDKNENFTLQNGILLSKDGTQMVLVPVGNISENFTIPDGVTSIGKNAFTHCLSIKQLTIPDSVKVISEFAFYGCDHLETVNMGSGVEEIHRAAFSYCRALKSITLPSGLKFIGNSAFADTNITTIVIPDSVTTLEVFAFGSCDQLASVTIGAGVIDIPKGCFAYCFHLTKIIIPDNVKSIGERAFDSCYDLVEVHIGNGVISIGEKAFYKCISLETVVLGRNVTEVKTDAFYDCRKLFRIFCLGTEDDWSNIAISEGNGEFTYAYRRFHYSEEKPESAGRYWYYGDKGQILIWETE